MPLPQLDNTIPKYYMTIPTTKEEVKFRPFLVGEQKTLLVAFESKDERQILTSMLDCLSNCVPNVNLKTLSTFDVDYMFTKVRAKSVGETTNVVHSCKECSTENKITLNLDDIKVDTTGFNDKTIVDISNDISIELQYPSYMDVIKNESFYDNKANQADVLMSSIKTVMKSVRTQDENILIKDEPKEEVDKFINSLTNTQLEKITSFAQNAPALTHTHTYECVKCNTENEVTFRGLQDFF
ncbi:MAG: hypothetical protein CMC82_04755 [Flavobacteriaceae bacterium]|nr:hypothetical protein [Flavobacteriaceae bacterium]